MHIKQCDWKCGPWPGSSWQATGLQNGSWDILELLNDGHCTKCFWCFCGYVDDFSLYIMLLAAVCQSCSIKQRYNIAKKHCLSAGILWGVGLILMAFGYVSLLYRIPLTHPARLRRFTSSASCFVVVVKVPFRLNCWMSLRWIVGSVVLGYWESLLQQLKAHMARQRLRERHQDELRRKLFKLKQEVHNQSHLKFVTVCICSSICNRLLAFAFRCVDLSLSNKCIALWCRCC